jgi:hypothetical protein
VIVAPVGGRVFLTFDASSAFRCVLPLNNQAIELEYIICVVCADHTGNKGYVKRV